MCSPQWLTYIGDCENAVVQVDQVGVVVGDCVQGDTHAWSVPEKTMLGGVPADVRICEVATGHRSVSRMPAGQLSDAEWVTRDEVV